MFDGLRSRGGIDGSKRGPYQPFGVAWRQIKELRLSYDKKIKEEVDTALRKACSKHKLRVSRSTVDSSFVIRSEVNAVDDDDNDQIDCVSDGQCIQMAIRANLKDQILMEEKEEDKLENGVLNCTYVVNKSPPPPNIFKPISSAAAKYNVNDTEQPHVASNDSDMYMYVMPKISPPPHLFKPSNSTSMCTRSNGTKSPDIEQSNDTCPIPKSLPFDPPPLLNPSKPTSMCTRSKKGIKSPDIVIEHSNNTYVVPTCVSPPRPSASMTMRTRSMDTNSPDTEQSNAASTDDNELFHTPCESQKHARSSSAELYTDIPAKIPASDEDDVLITDMQSNFHPEKDDRFTGLVRNSPVKAVEAHELRTKLLKDKINQKLEREESRRRELEAKKEKDRLDRIKRREERLQKVAANKAALLKKANEKKKKIEASKDEPPPIKTIAASKTEDKGQKNKLRHQAAEQRRKEKERENELKQRAIEKEKQLQEELHRKRMEMKEQIRLQKQLDKDEHKKPVVPATTTYTTISSASVLLPPAATCTSHYTTPLNKCVTTVSTTCASSYEITPMSQDPLLVADNNYDIAELSSDDSSDDEDCPKKTVPMWAAPMNLNRIISDQERTDHDVDSIFPPTDLLQSPDLRKIFGFSKRRFLKRTSSAQWTSPMLKKTRPLTENNNNNSS